MNEDEERFEIVLEADVFRTVRKFSSEHSHFSSDRRLGWISLDSRDAELTDEDVFRLLDTAHAEKSLAYRFGAIMDRETRWLDSIAESHKTRKQSKTVKPKDIRYQNRYFSGFITDSYLQELCTKFDDSGKVLFSLMNYDTPIDNGAERLVRRLIHETDDFSDIHL
jgi:hypothetical protein